MENDLKTARNRPEKGLVSKLRNQLQEIPLIRVVMLPLQTNISAAC